MTESGIVRSPDEDTFIHTFMHCRSCVVMGGKTQLEVGLSRTGVVVRCKRHGIVGHLSPTQLENVLHGPPLCDDCARGVPHVH